MQTKKKNKITKKVTNKKDTKIVKKERSTSTTNAIFCIINRGFTDLVMVAARKHGAGGGTVMHARGTGNKEIEKFYGISVTPEKEIVMIVVKEELTDEILKAINQEAGLDSPGQGIAFAIPVSDYIGINLHNKL